MSHPLDGCRAKIDRANHHVNRLAEMAAEFISTHGHDFRIEPEGESIEHIFYAFGPPPPPLDFAIRTGEAINQMRSSLDHLIWQLVLKRQATADFKVQYPICLCVSDYKSAVNNGIVQGVSKRAQSIIERTQPYRAAKPADQNCRF